MKRSLSGLGRKCSYKQVNVAPCPETDQWGNPRAGHLQYKGVEFRGAMLVSLTRVHLNQPNNVIEEGSENTQQ